MRTDTQYDRFPISKRGYDPSAVEAFLELSTSESERTLNEAAAQIAALDLQLEEARKQEEAVHLTILAATKAKEDMLEAAKHQATDLTEKARKEGDRIVTDARMQAFQSVTGAREEAESIVSEARVEAGAITRMAAGTAKTDSTEPSMTEHALQARIEAMQGVIQSMEHELATRPTTSDPRSPNSSSSTEALETDDVIHFDTEESTPNEPEVPIETETIESEIEVVVSDDAELEATEDLVAVAEPEPIITIEPASDDLPASTDEAEFDDDIEEKTADAIRRSFYSRRSAKLPQMGSEAGRGALAAAAGLRTNLTGSERAGDAEVDPSSPTLEAV